MWSGNNNETTDDESWEVRAFEEDTAGNLLGCTWPPRSYTCTFCRREFRSAQALGGHMNVHRRDRARLHQLPPPLPVSLPPAAAATEVLSSSAVFIPAGSQEFVVGNGNGLCLVYPLHNPNCSNTILIPAPPVLDNFPSHEYSTLLPKPHFFKSEPPNHIDTAANSVVSSLSCHCSNTNTEPSPSNSNENSHVVIKDENVVKDSAIEEELDLELRLGRRKLD